ncbi:hypothetical protein BDZ91DRAFT_34321 [Kalaharituber pfeilii]|nr:hypothetical protein BDZ91DRAFT_34321 [Kalaharituber pfeilii]
MKFAFTGAINKSIQSAENPHGHTLSQTDVFVSGYSAGAYLARLACLLHHTYPREGFLKPKGAFLLAGQGGEWFSQRYVLPKAMFMAGKVAIGRRGGKCDGWLYLESGEEEEEEEEEQQSGAKHIVESGDRKAQQWESLKRMLRGRNRPPTEAAKRKMEKRRRKLKVESDLGNWSTPLSPTCQQTLMAEMRATSERMALATTLYHSGLLLDYLTGVPGLSRRLLNRFYVPNTNLEAGKEEELLASLLPEECRVLFPEVVLREKEAARGHPPTILVHGTRDMTVAIAEAEKTERQIREAGGRALLIKAEGWDHGYQGSVWEKWARGRVVEFLKEALDEGVGSEREGGELESGAEIH